MLPIVVLILRILMVIVLYSFLGWTIYTLWSDLRFHSQILAHQKTPPITLVMDNDRQEEKQSFTQNEVLIGRDENCDVNLPDPVVSGRHARLVYRNMHWWVEDLISTNGTYLNDERVETPAILINGDELRIGKTILVVAITATS